MGEPLSQSHRYKISKSLMKNQNARKGKLVPAEDVPKADTNSTTAATPGLWDIPIGEWVHDKWDWEVHRKNVFGSNDSRSGRALIRPKATLRQMGSMESRKHPRYNKALMNVKVTYPTPSRDRDAANLYPTMKAYIDGLTHPDLSDRHNPLKGILPDDNDVYFTGPFIRWSGERREGDLYIFHIELIGRLDPLA